MAASTHGLRASAVTLRMPRPSKRPLPAGRQFRAEQSPCPLPRTFLGAQMLLLRIIRRPSRADPETLARTRSSAASSGTELVEECSTTAPAAPLLDLGGLKKEVARHQARAIKKAAKAYEKLRSAEDQAVKLLDSDDLAALEACPDTVALEASLAEARQRLKELNDLSDELSLIKKATDDGFPEISERAMALGIEDHPPERPQRGPKRPKGQQPPPRKPYWRFSSIDNIEIRVGREASDNDSLSCNPQHRDGQDWWMHVAGCPGSHVVIRTHDDHLPEGTIKDAAALAAKFSKASQSGKVGVNLVRCRQVSKPPGAKPGLVHLSGEVLTVKISVKTEAARLERLEETKKQ